ncbi:cytochrome P450 [Nocardia sp. NPDC050378]|uniref:cytochrome P450 n=1 Tax=Nocardia sp. NPDC050378 TaxID=3155400 RepID=UPI0033E34CAA
MNESVSITDHRYENRVDISSSEFWALDHRQRDDKAFAWLRSNAPVSWHRPVDSLGFPHQEKGFWAITRAADIRFVSNNHEHFSSNPYSLALPPHPPAPRNMLSSDPPEHERYRQMISASFTPKAVKRLAAKIDERAAQIVERVRGAGEIDFVKEVSSKLPMLTIADLFGLPEELVPAFTEAGDRWATASDPAVCPEGVSVVEFRNQQLQILVGIGIETVTMKRSTPGDDLATFLANGKVDGRPLTNEEVGACTLLLCVAGNDTTKQTTGSAVYELWNAPEQKQLLADQFDDLIPGAIEEFVRFASPVESFARRATQDTEIAGTPIAKHDKVVLFYGSGNRDETEFTAPWKFDITRGRTPHIGFGGGGIHYCLGNAVAKAQLRALFAQFLDKLWDMEVGEPQRLESTNFNGFRTLPVRIR